MGLGKFIKSKCEKLLRPQQRQRNKFYQRVDPTDSMRVEASSRLAQKLIAETLKAADSPGRKALTI
ncbi:hypothetical protein KP509_01G042400 [Ceratopteris richardii]|uniref:Uncharacterized protein n=1 Tax=Ceratopteris richardii TaxID=49495 RepID=A0A8T2VJ84_CERRI|nr:hypothetical protein KP509_01G042400 [Ceratopteris richardii]